MSRKSNAYSKGYTDRELGNRKIPPGGGTWLEPKKKVTGKKSKEINLAYDKGWDDCGKDGRAWNRPSQWKTR